MAVNKRKILETAQKHLQKGALDKALKEYLALLKADPRDSSVRLKVGDLYLKLGKTDDAVAAYLRVAESFMNEGFDAKAVALYKQITKIDSKRFDVYAPLAELYQRMGLTSDAMKALQTAADASYREGAKDQALDLLRRMGALDPTNTTNRMKVADLLHKEQRNDEAIAEYDAVLKELERRGDTEECTKVLERVLEIDPSRVAVRVALGRARLAGQNAAAAEKIGRALVADHPDEVEGYEIHAEALALAGRKEQSADVYRQLAELYRARGDEARARDIMQRFGAPVSALRGDDSDELVLETDDDLAFDTRSEGAELGLDAPEFNDPGFLSGEGMRLGDPLGADADAPQASAPEPEPELEPAPARAPAPPRAAPAPPASEASAGGDPDQLVAEASVYLRYGKHDRAFASLEAALASEPDHLAALEKLGETHAAAGDPEAAATHWLRAAELARDAGDAETLERVRARLEAVDPAAAETLGGTPAADADAGGEELALEDLDVEIDPGGSSDPPSELAETLDEDNVGFELSFGDETGEPVVPEETGEPAAAPPEPDLEPAPAAAASADAGDIDVDVDIDGFDDAGADSAATDEVEAAPSEPPAGAESSSSTAPAQLREDLEEADFYFQQGMYDEARRIYERVIGVAPNHPQAMLRLGEIEAAQGAAAAPAASPPEGEAQEPGGFSLNLDDDFDLDTTEPPAEAGATPETLVDEPTPEFAAEPDAEETPAAEAPRTRVEPPAAAPQTRAERPAAAPRPARQAAAEITAPSLPPSVASGPEEESEVASGGAGGDFDLAAELSEALDDERPTGSHRATGGGTEAEGFEQVFAAFKEGVRGELDEGDHQAHYDLGIAYKEMGLLEDAIGEFQQAMRDDSRALGSLHMMGLCALELGRLADATAHLEQALARPGLTDELQLGLRFDLGRAYAAAGDRQRARTAFEAVQAIDPEFCDVGEQLAELDAASGSGGAPAGAAGETFESFDDLISEGDAESEPPRARAPQYESFDDLMGDDDDDEEPTGPTVDPEPLEAIPLEDEVEPEPEPPTRGGAGRGRRKKISFV